MISKLTIYIGLLLLSSLALAEAPQNSAAAMEEKPLPVTAEQPAQITDPKNNTKITAIIAGVEKSENLHPELAEIKSLLEEAVGEDKESLTLRWNEKRAELLTALEEVSFAVKELQDEGQDASKYLTKIKTDLFSAGQHFRNSITENETIFTKHDKDRDTLTSDGLKNYIKESQTVDLGYTELHQYSLIIERMGFEAKPSRLYLNEELPKRIETLAGRIHLTLERRKELQKKLSIKPDNPTVIEQISFVEEKLTTDSNSLRNMIKLTDNMDVNVDEYNTLLVRASGEITAEVLSTAVISELIADWWGNTKDTIKANSVSIVLKVLLFVFVIFIFRILAALTSRLVIKSVASTKVNLSTLVKEMITVWISRAVMFVGFLIALSQVGVSLAPVLAGMGVMGFIVGFALQDTLGNFAAGIMILLYRPYDVGDYVEAGGATGTVKTMNLVSTTILTIDNQTLFIPNSKIWGDVIKNVTAQRVRRIDMVFGIGYGDSIEKAETVLADILEKHEAILSKPAPVIRVHSLGESSIDFVVRPWVKTDDYWETYWFVTREVKLRFDAEEISIPFPQRDIHVIQTENTEALPISDRSAEKPPIPA